MKLPAGPSSRGYSRGDSYEEGCLRGSLGARSFEDPVQRGRSGQPNTCGQRIDHEIHQSRMPSRRPKLQDLDHAGHRDSDQRDPCPVPCVGEAKSEANEDKGQRMLAVLAEIGMRPILWRAQRRKGNRGRQQPGKHSEINRHRHRIARIGSQYSATAKWVQCLVNAQSYSGCRTPIPCMKRSLIWTGSRRVVPVPGLSSMRTPISVGPEADMDWSIRRSKSSSSAAQVLLARPLAVAMATRSVNAAAGVGCAPVI